MDAKSPLVRAVARKPPTSFTPVAVCLAALLAAGALGFAVNHHTHRPREVLRYIQVRTTVMPMVQVVPTVRVVPMVEMRDPACPHRTSASATVEHYSE